MLLFYLNWLRKNSAIRVYLYVCVYLQDAKKISIVFGLLATVFKMIWKQEL